VHGNRGAAQTALRQIRAHASNNPADGIETSPPPPRSSAGA